jgi:hypothetical protein
MNANTATTPEVEVLSSDDFLAIQNLYGRYYMTFDELEAEKWAACFTPDGVFLGPGLDLVGTEALVGFANATFEAVGRIRHVTSNLIIEASPAGARGTCALMLVKQSEGETPPVPLGTAVYTDELVKQNGEWLFSKRTARADGPTTG